MYSRSEVIGSWRKQDSGNQGWNKQDSTGRISFKLYDWNPAEFPRHQIFQWLSSMPVELEGYIRPGCIILTLFIAMPHFTGRSYLKTLLAIYITLLMHLKVCYLEEAQ